LLDAFLRWDDFYITDCTSETLSVKDVVDLGPDLIENTSRITQIYKTCRQSRGSYWSLTLVLDITLVLLLDFWLIDFRLS